MTTATAPGKLILFGEHAAVYSRPAIAIPLTDRVATATIVPSADNTTLTLPDVGKQFTWPDESAEADSPLLNTLNRVQRDAGLDSLPPMTITVTSTIPIAGGMGSGAAVAAALIRALLRHLDLNDADDRVNALTYTIEQRYHGTPSGIDNTVVSYRRAVWFIKQDPTNLIEPIAIGAPLHLLVADSGVRSATGTVVGDVRRQWQADPDRFNSLFDKCGRLANNARRALAAGDLLQVGALMTLNHVQLRRMTVSSRELDDLVDAALNAGALGAKLSGAGRGGVVVALADAAHRDATRHALLEAGAASVWDNVVPATEATDS